MKVPEFLVPKHEDVFREEFIVIGENSGGSLFNLLRREIVWAISRKIDVPRREEAVQPAACGAYRFRVYSFVGKDLVHQSKVAVPEILITRARIRVRG